MYLPQVYTRCMLISPEKCNLPISGSDMTPSRAHLLGNMVMTQCVASFLQKKQTQDVRILLNIFHLTKWHDIDTDVLVEK